MENHKIDDDQYEAAKLHAKAIYQKMEPVWSRALRAEHYHEPRKERRMTRTKLHGKRETMMAMTQFWSLRVVVEHQPVTVVIRQIENGKQHFFSIY